MNPSKLLIKYADYDHCVNEVFGFINITFPVKIILSYPFELGLIAQYNSCNKNK